MTEIKEIVPLHGYVIFISTLLSWLAQLRRYNKRYKPWLRSDLHVQRCELCLLRAESGIGIKRCGSGNVFRLIGESIPIGVSIFT